MRTSMLALVAATALASPLKRRDDSACQYVIDHYSKTAQPNGGQMQIPFDVEKSWACMGTAAISKEDRMTIVNQLETWMAFYGRGSFAQEEGELANALASFDAAKKKWIEADSTRLNFLMGMSRVFAMVNEDGMTFRPWFLFETHFKDAQFITGLKAKDSEDDRFYFTKDLEEKKDQATNIEGINGLSTDQWFNVGPAQEVAAYSRAARQNEILRVSQVASYMHDPDYNRARFTKNQLPFKMAGNNEVKVDLVSSQAMDLTGADSQDKLHELWNPIQGTPEITLSIRPNEPFFPKPYDYKTAEGKVFTKHDIISGLEYDENGKKIVVLVINSFSRRTSTESAQDLLSDDRRKAIKEFFAKFKDQDATLVLDVRDNRGGSLQPMVDIFKMVFPDKDINTYVSYPTTPALDVLGTATYDLIKQDKVADMLGLRDVVDKDGNEIENWEKFFRGGNKGLTPVHRVRMPQATEQYDKIFNNVILFSDGRCTRECHMFALGAQKAGAKTVVATSMKQARKEEVQAAGMSASGNYVSSNDIRDAVATALDSTDVSEENKVKIRGVFAHVLPEKLQRPLPFSVTFQNLHVDKEGYPLVWKEKGQADALVRYTLDNWSDLSTLYGDVVKATA